MEKKTKIIIFTISALVLSLVLIITTYVSLKKNAELPPVSDNEEELPDSGVPYSPIPSLMGPVNSGDDLLTSPFIGSFENSYVAFFSSEAGDIFGYSQAGEPPRLMIDENGGFTLSINAYEAGMLKVSGVVEVDGDIALFTIESKPVIDYFGSEVESFSMRLISEDDMRYSGDRLGTITKGDIFSRSVSG